MLNSPPTATTAPGHSIESIYETARARWSAFDVPSGEFARCLAERQQAAGADRCFEYAADLYLVCACLRGVPSAIRTLEQQYLEPVLPTLAATAANREDLRQTVLERLLLRNDLGHCRLEEYSGRSSLRAWLRVVAKRVQLNLVRGQANKPTREIHDALETQLISAGSDPELDYFRLRYAHEFKQAFRAALRKLGSRDILVLRMHLLERSSGAEIAALFGVNRATVVRWMADTRQELLSSTRQRLQQELSLSQTECDSVVRLAIRQLDISLSALREGADS